MTGKIKSTSSDISPLLNANSSLRLDATYYISRVLIPPLDRILSLVGVDVRSWFDEMRKPQYSADLVLSPTKATEVHESPSPPDINHDSFNSQCLACGEYSSQGEIYFTSCIRQL